MTPDSHSSLYSSSSMSAYTGDKIRTCKHMPPGFESGSCTDSDTPAYGREGSRTLMHKATVSKTAMYTCSITRPYGADETRTHMIRLSRDFKTRAYTISATAPYLLSFVPLSRSNRNDNNMIFFPFSFLLLTAGTDYTD